MFKIFAFITLYLQCQATIERFTHVIEFHFFYGFDARIYYEIDKILIAQLIYHIERASYLVHVKTIMNVLHLWKSRANLTK